MVVYAGLLSSVDCLFVRPLYGMALFYVGRPSDCFSKGSPDKQTHMKKG